MPKRADHNPTQIQVGCSIEASRVGPQRKNIVFLGTATRQVGELDKKSKEVKDTIEAKARVNWKGCEEGGFVIVNSIMQRPDPPDL